MNIKAEAKRQLVTHLEKEQRNIRYEVYSNTSKINQISNNQRVARKKLAEITKMIRSLNQ